MDTEGGNFNTIMSFDMEEGKRGKKIEPKMSRGTREFNVKLRIFITIFWLCVTALVEYLFIWKLFPELPGEIVGRVRIKIAFDNLNYTDDLASSDSVRYKKLSEEFIALVDRRLKNSSLADFYTRSEIDGFENGSVIIKFNSTFKQKNRMLPLKNQIEDVLQNYIFPDKFNITLENTSVVVKSKPDIISYDLVRDTSASVMIPSTPASADMTLPPSSTANMTLTTSSTANMTLTTSSTADMTLTTSSTANMTLTTSSTADMILTTSSTANMTDTTTTKTTIAKTTSISGTNSSASITISLVVSTNSTPTTTTITASTTSVSMTTSSAASRP